MPEGTHEAKLCWRCKSALGKKYFVRVKSQDDVNVTGECAMCHNWKVVRLCTLEPKDFKGDELHERFW